ncbi:protein of unknown function [Methylocaldum szegediense]|uniref:Uncharacterized protein n=1 Tax=Methylocaldum szegediense TaxID=73780 RepID=A0ABM9I3N2_9GAMM|nr:protein of unknown function [Methylocaldum szegediense]
MDLIIWIRVLKKPEVSGLVESTVVIFHASDAGTADAPQPVRCTMFLIRADRARTNTRR